jgi:hypothetical protein
MVTDVTTIRALMEQHGDQVLCVLSTTSCFAPRQPDLVDEIAVLCKQYDCGHVINNAYGLQCETICKKINRAITIGRVDAGIVCCLRLNSFVFVVMLITETSLLTLLAWCGSDRQRHTILLWNRILIYQCNECSWLYFT